MENSLIEKGLNEMLAKNGHRYLKLSIYLRSELKQGKTDFRIHINSDNTVYIHPIDKDGETLDLELF